MNELTILALMVIVGVAIGSIFYVQNNRSSGTGFGNETVPKTANWFKLPVTPTGTVGRMVLVAGALFLACVLFQSDDLWKLIKNILPIFGLLCLSFLFWNLIGNETKRYNWWTVNHTIYSAALVIFVVLLVFKLYKTNW